MYPCDLTGSARFERGLINMIFESLNYRHVLCLGDYVVPKLRNTECVYMYQHNQCVSDFALYIVLDT